MLAAILVASCGPPCAREGLCVEQSLELPDRPLYSVTLTTLAVSCTPYEEYAQMQTGTGELVTGLAVCAEFEGACACETSEQVRVGLAVVDRVGGCFSWNLVESTFWAYSSGTICEAETSWELDVQGYDGSACGFAIEPQFVEGELVRVEIVCEWSTDDSSVAVTDRLLIQTSPNTSLNPDAGWTREE